MLKPYDEQCDEFLEDRVFVLLPRQIYSILLL
jgi:hypothetical protein